MVESDCIFIHVPKCAGGSLSTAFRSHGYRHLNKRKCLSNFDNQGFVSFGHLSVQQLIEDGHLDIDYFNNAFKFAFVRNPWCRAVSLWTYAKQDMGRLLKGDSPPEKFTDYIQESINSKEIPIEDYSSKPKNLKTLIRNKELRAKNHKIIANPMCNWLLDPDGKLMVDFVGRFENLQEDFNFVCGKIGIPPRKLPHKTKSKRARHYTEYYNDEAKEMVAKKYAKDIEYFGYEFGKNDKS